MKAVSFQDTGRGWIFANIPKPITYFFLSHNLHGFCLILFSAILSIPFPKYKEKGSCFVEKKKKI